MQENKNQLREESIDFAIMVSDACDETKGCSVYVNQLLRCSSSIGANIHEAQYAQSKRDFVAKLEIALKESNETSYWLKLMFETKRIDAATYQYTEKLCGNIRKLLIASCKTAKENAK